MMHDHESGVGVEVLLRDDDNHDIVTRERKHRNRMQSHQDTTGMICRSEFIQYARKKSVDPRGLGRWCSCQFFCNPNHLSKIVVAYRTCRLKVKGLRTIYQQQLRYIQAHGINCSPVELFDRDLAKQIKEWKKSGERIVLVMDVNDHPLTSKFYQQLQKGGNGLRRVHP